MLRTLPELQQRLRELLPRIQVEFAVQDLGVFGSYVSGGASPESDLDLLVTFRETPSLFRYIELENLLTDELGVKVDLVLRKALKPQIGKRVLEEVVAI